MSRVVVWFSCGAASAVASKLAIEKYGHENVCVAYCDMTLDEDPDNVRFRADVARWLDHPVTLQRPELHRHHRDEDPTNNVPENIQILCRACHNAVHRELAKAAAASQKSSALASASSALDVCAVTAMPSYRKSRRNSSQ